MDNHDIDLRKTGAAALYDAFHEEQGAAWQELAALQKAAHICELAGDVPHERVLDIGCGGGAVLETLSQREFGSSFWAIDISPVAIEEVKARAIPGLCEARTFDGVSLPYGGGAFDMAILSHVIEHVDEPRSLLREAGRVARHVFVEVPLEDNLTLRSNAGPWDTMNHINWYNHKTLRRLAQTSGLRVKRSLVRNATFRAHRHLWGWKAPFVYLPKQVALMAAPPLGRAIFTYFGAILCGRLEEPGRP